MPWEQSTSASFRARHDSGDVDDAHRVLQSLERARERLEPVFPRGPTEITVVLHTGPAALALSNPLLPLAWLATAPSGRRYVAGWAGRDEIHVLSPAALRRRASAVAGSHEMLGLAAAALYARRVIAESNPALARETTPTHPLIRLRRELRWAWLIEGSARWYVGQTAHARPAIVRRLREGGRPSFPPSLRDAPLLGGTVLDLLAAEQGDRAAARLATRLHPQGPRAALERAFGRPLVHTEGDWRSHLAQLASAPDRPSLTRPGHQT